MSTETIPGTIGRARCGHARRSPPCDRVVSGHCAGSVAACSVWSGSSSPAGSRSTPMTLADNELVAEAVTDAAAWVWAYQVVTVGTAILVAVFAAGLFRKLSQQGPAQSLCPMLAVSGLLLVSAMSLVGGGICTEMFWGLTRDTAELDADTVAAQMAIFNTMAWVWAGAGLAAGAVAVAGLRHGAVSRALGIGSVLAATLIALAQHRAAAVHGTGARCSVADRCRHQLRPGREVTSPSDQDGRSQRLPGGVTADHGAQQRPPAGRSPCSPPRGRWLRWRSCWFRSPSRPGTSGSGTASSTPPTRSSSGRSRRCCWPVVATRCRGWWRCARWAAGWRPSRCSGRCWSWPTPTFPSCRSCRVRRTGRGCPGTYAMIILVPGPRAPHPMAMVERVFLVVGTVAISGLTLMRLTDPYPWPDGPTATPFAIRSTWWLDLIERTVQAQFLVVCVLADDRHGGPGVAMGEADAEPTPWARVARRGQRADDGRPSSRWRCRRRGSPTCPAG